MKKIDFADLVKNDFFLKNIVTDFQFWRASQSWATPTGGRINTAVIMVLSRNALYKMSDGSSVYACPGDILLLPKGSEYVCTFSNCEDGIDLKYKGFPRSCLFLGFELYNYEFKNITFEGQPRIILRGRNIDLLKSFESLCKLRHRPTCTPGLLCGTANVFLSSLCTKYNSTIPENKTDTVLSELAAYIYENASEVTVGMLTEMSGMSASTLRRKFAARFGTTPVGYINSVKIENAKTLFESGITKIKDVSMLCGIEDEFYFSRLFAKIAGMPPSAYVKMIKNTNK